MNPNDQAIAAILELVTKLDTKTDGYGERLSRIEGIIERYDASNDRIDAERIRREAELAGKVDALARDVANLSKELTVCITDFRILQSEHENRKRTLAAVGATTATGGGIVAWLIDRFLNGGGQ